MRVDSSKLKVHDPNAVEELLSLVVLGATFWEAPPQGW